MQVVGHKATPKSVFFCCLDLGHTIQLRRTNCWYTTVGQHKDREASYSQCTLHRRRLYCPSCNALWHVAEYFSMATFNLIVFMRPTLFFSSNATHPRLMLFSRYSPSLDKFQPLPSSRASVEFDVCMVAGVQPICIEEPARERHQTKD